MNRRDMLLKLLSAICLLLFLCGCAASETESRTRPEQTSPGTEASGEAAKEKLKIGVSIYRYDDNFMRQYRGTLKQYLEETYDADVLMRNAGNDETEQKKQLAEFIREGCDGVILNLVDVGDAKMYADRCHAAGIPVVFINREPAKEEEARWEREGIRASCVATDSTQAGQYQGEIILELPDRGDISQDGTVSCVVIMGEAGSKDSENRSEYAVKALENAGLGTRILFSGYGNWDEAEGKKLAKEALKNYGRQIEVIFCGNDAMAHGALEALEEAGRTNGRDIYLVGVDALEETVCYIKEGKITGTVYNDHTGQSHQAADTLVKMIQGEAVEREYLVDYIKITMADPLM